MTIPSHSLVMAAAELVGRFEIRDGYAKARLVSAELDELMADVKQLESLNAAAGRMTRNEMKDALAFLVMGGLLLKQDSAATA